MPLDYERRPPWKDDREPPQWFILWISLSLGLLTLAGMCGYWSLTR